MKSCSRTQEGENCCRWSHVGEDLIGFSLAIGASASQHTKYDDAVGMDVEVLGLIGGTVGGESSDIALLYVHLGPMLCEYRCDR